MGKEQFKTVVHRCLTIVGAIAKITPTPMDNMVVDLLKSLAADDTLLDALYDLLLAKGKLPPV